MNQQYGTSINQYTFQDLDKLEALIKKVVAWDRTTPHAYDQRWINLHGMKAMAASRGGNDASQDTLSLPEKDWDAIAEKTRSDYVRGLEQVLGQLRGIRQQ